jgi:hypothetical protein
MSEIPKTCPHCESRLVEWRVPDEASWSEDFFFACFNDDCPYYEQGWDWMREHYNQNVSYRHAVNPKTGTPFPLPVWSASATREMIVDDSEGDDE